MGALVVAGDVAAAAEDVAALAHLVGGDVDGGADCVFGALGAAYELDF